METLLRTIPESLFILVDGSLYMSMFFNNNNRNYSNNSIEVNLLECSEKEEFVFEKLDSCHHTETESATGRIAASL